MLTLPLPNRITEKLPFGPEPIRIPAGTIHPLQNELYNRGFEVPIITWRNGLSNNGEPTMLIRVAAQVYCCLDDYRHLLATIDEIVQ